MWGLDKTVLKLLASSDAWIRLAACNALGIIGSESAIEKLEIIAESDPADEVVEERGRSGAMYAKVTYPVRTACRASVGKLKLAKP